MSEEYSELPDHRRTHLFSARNAPSRHSAAFDIHKEPARRWQFERCGDGRRRNNHLLTCSNKAPPQYFFLFPFSFCRPACLQSRVDVAINASAPRLCLCSMAALPAGKNRQGFSHREADEKSRLDEAIRRGMGERRRANGRGGLAESG